MDVDLHPEYRSVYWEFEGGPGARDGFEDAVERLDNGSYRRVFHVDDLPRDVKYPDGFAYFVDRADQLFDGNCDYVEAYTAEATKRVPAFSDPRAFVESLVAGDMRGEVYVVDAMTEAGIAGDAAIVDRFEQDVKDESVVDRLLER